MLHFVTIKGQGPGLVNVRLCRVSSVYNKISSTVNALTAIAAPRRVQHAREASAPSYPHPRVHALTACTRAAAHTLTRPARPSPPPAPPQPSSRTFTRTCACACHRPRCRRRRRRR